MEIKIDDRFGKLVVKGAAEKRKGHYRYKCLCDCGNRKVIRRDSLLNGTTQSCGCLQKERVKKAKATHRMTGTRTYSSWSHMIHRCTNLNDDRFKDYGGRGIKVCKKWMRFENFYKQMKTQNAWPKWFSEVADLALT